MKKGEGMEESPMIIEEIKARIETLAQRLEEIQLIEDSMPKLDYLATTRILTIKEFFICKLAGQLYDCVDCPEPRWNIDRQTAESFVNTNCSTDLLKRIAKRDLLLRAYEHFIAEKENERHVLPAVDISVVNATWNGHDKYHEIILRLAKLPTEQLEMLVQEATGSSASMDRYIGRIVWDQGYQRIKTDLPRPPYGNIRFS